MSELLERYRRLATQPCCREPEYWYSGCDPTNRDKFRSGNESVVKSGTRMKSVHQRSIPISGISAVESQRRGLFTPIGGRGRESRSLVVVRLLCIPQLVGGKNESISIALRIGRDTLSSSRSVRKQNMSTSTHRSSTRSIFKLRSVTNELAASQLILIHENVRVGRACLPVYCVGIQ